MNIWVLVTLLGDGSDPITWGHPDSSLYGGSFVYFGSSEELEGTMQSQHIIIMNVYVTCSLFKPQIDSSGKDWVNTDDPWSLVSDLQESGNPLPECQEVTPCCSYADYSNDPIVVPALDNPINLSDYQLISEKDQPNGYVGIDFNGFISPGLTGFEWDFATTSLRPIRAFRPLDLELELTDDYLVINRSADTPIYKIVNNADAPILRSIKEENDLNFVHGVEYELINSANTEIVILKENSGLYGDSFTWVEPIDAFIWPVGLTIKIKWDESVNYWIVKPYFTTSELRNKFSGFVAPLNITSGNYHLYHNKVISAYGESVIFDVSIPDGFKVDIFMLTTNDVEILASGGASIRNRQNHTKIAGQWGVVSVIKIDGEFILMGDTKA